jgi:hypothetical protein
MLCKIKINKDGRTSQRTDFKYPKGYDYEKYVLLSMQNEGLDEEFVMATTDLTESELPTGITKLTTAEAETLGNTWIDNDKDVVEYDSEKFASLGEYKTSLKADLKNKIPSDPKA